MQELMLMRIGPRTFQLMQDFVSECGITVPIGFISDGLSAPNGFRWLASPTGHGFNAALVHDYLLKEGYLWEHANERFEAQLVHDEVSYVRRKLYMLGVTLWSLLRK